MILNLLTLILVWAAVGLFIWYVLLRFIPRAFLTWFGGAILLTLIVWSFVEPNDETIGTIWKIISFPLKPLGFSLLLLSLSLGGFTFKEGFKPARGRYVAVAFAILLFSSVPLIARTLVNQAEQAVSTAYDAQRGICADVCPVEIPESAPLSQIVGVVVLAENMDVVAPAETFPSRVDSGTELSPVLTAQINSAADLYGRLRASGISPFVYVTAGPVVGDSDDEAPKEQRLRQFITARGIPAEVLVIEDTGTDVHQTVDDVEEYLEEQNLLTSEDTPSREANRIALVAPALSMRRAALTFEQENIEVVAWPTNIYGGSEPTIDDDVLATLSDLVPSAEALRLTTRYWDEVLTSFYYFLRGWLPGFDVRWDEVVEILPQ